MSDATVEIMTDVVESMPELERQIRTGVWTDTVGEAVQDGKPRATRGVPADAIAKVRRQLAHTASDQFGKGFKSVVKEEDSGPVIFWQITEKSNRGRRSTKPVTSATVADGGTAIPSTPVPDASDETTSGAGTRSRKAS